MTDEKAAGPKPEMPLPAHAISLPEEINRPNLTEDLLNAQLAEVLSIIRDAGYIYRNNPLPAVERAIIVSHATALMSASAKLADRILRLKGGETADKRIHYVVEHREGEGVARIEKRIPTARGNGRADGNGHDPVNANAHGHAGGNGHAGANGHAHGNGQSHA